MTHFKISRPLGAAATLVAALLLLGSRPAHAARIVLKDGRILEGKLAPLVSVSNKLVKPKENGAPIPKLILLCDDGLRRYYIFEKFVEKVLEGEGGDPPERLIMKNQPVAEGGSTVASVGPMKRVKPFDEWGRRTVEMVTEKRNITIYQGITEITPTWTKVQGLHLQGSPAYVWDQRIATNSLPHELLAKIVAKQINPKNVDQRLKIVRLYLQMERDQEAKDELAKVIEDFPDHAAQFAHQEGTGPAHRAADADRDSNPARRGPAPIRHAVAG